MFGKLSFAKNTALGVIAVAGVAGWIFALYQNQQIGILKRDLERQTFANEEFKQARRELMTAQTERDRCRTEAEVLATQPRGRLILALAAASCHFVAVLETLTK